MTLLFSQVLIKYNNVPNKIDEKRKKSANIYYL